MSVAAQVAKKHYRAWKRFNESYPPEDRLPAVSLKEWCRQHHPGCPECQAFLASKVGG